MSLKPYALGIFGEGAGLGGAAVRIQTGVTALYGLNGAGKTRLLQAMRSAANPIEWTPLDQQGVGLIAWYRFEHGDLHQQTGLRWSEKTRLQDEVLIENLADAFQATWSAATSDMVNELTLGEERFQPAVLSADEATSLARYVVGNSLLGVIVASHDVGSKVAVLGLRKADLVPQLHDVLSDSTVVQLAAADPRQYLDRQEVDEITQDITNPSEIGISHNGFRFWGAARIDFDDAAAILLDLRPGETGVLFADVSASTTGHHYNEWWPEPVYVICDLDHLVVRFPCVFDEEDERSLEDMVREVLERRKGPGPDHCPIPLLGPNNEPSAELVGFLAQSGAEATRVLRLLLESAPELQCLLTDPEDWFFGSALRWVGVDLTGRHIPIDRLSQAQARWSRFAIRWAVAKGFDLVVIDEPEAALHTRAVRHLFHGLKVLAEEGDVPFVVATHARDVMRDPDIHLMHVQRSKSGLTVKELDAPLRAVPAELGIDIADMLQLVRFFVLVEGRHDEVVLDCLVGQELAHLGVRILPVRGGSQLKATAHSEFLFDFTDARIVAVVDNVQAGKLRGLVQLLQDESEERAIRALLDVHLDKKITEEGFLHGFLWRCWTEKRLDRVQVHSFSEPDIIYYLDCQTLTDSKFSNWASTRSAFETSGGKDIKTWLGGKGVTFDDDALRRAAAASASIHDDINGLLELVRNWPR